jgi:hypothetical protein
MRGQTPSEAFLVGARSLQGATPQCLPGEKHLNLYLRSVASACAAVRPAPLLSLSQAKNWAYRPQRRWPLVDYVLPSVVIL